MTSHPGVDSMYDPTTIVPSGVRLTVDDVLTSLEKAVEEKGADWIDPGALPEGYGCRYSVYDQEDKPVAPSCIVGNVLHQHGVVVARGDEAGSAWSLLRRMESQGFVVEQQAVEVLQAAQHKQDNGAPWGDALQAARDQAVSS